MQNTLTNRRAILLAEILVVAYLGIVGFSAHHTGISLLLFPELAALSHDVFTRPRGKWATQPWQIVLTPTLTAILGLFITRHAAFGVVPVTIITIASLVVIKVLRSDISPAISAGVLPLVLGIKSWLYPVTILADLIALLAVLLLWKRFGPRFDHPSPIEAEESKLIDALEAPSHDRYWVLVLLASVIILTAIAELTGLRFLLFPPLVVMGYEIFGHPELPGWMARPVLLPVVCLLTAGSGLISCRIFGLTFTGVAIAMLCQLCLLRFFKVHMPPALAVGLLPFVIAKPTVWYPISVMLGTAALTLFSACNGHLRLYARTKRTRLKLTAD